MYPFGHMVSLINSIAMRWRAMAPNMARASARWFCHACLVEFRGEQGDGSAEVACPGCTGAFVELIVPSSRPPARTADDELDAAEIFFNLTFFSETPLADSWARGTPSTDDIRSRTPPTPAPSSLHHLSSTKLTAAQIEHEPECAICSEEYREGEEVSELRCGHHYHRWCISDWLSRQCSCPVCREALPVPPPPATHAATRLAASAFTGAELVSPRDLARAIGTSHFPQLSGGGSSASASILALRGVPPLSPGDRSDSSERTGPSDEWEAEGAEAAVSRDGAPRQRAPESSAVPSSCRPGGGEAAGGAASSARALPPSHPHTHRLPPPPAAETASLGARRACNFCSSLSFPRRAARPSRAASCDGEARDLERRAPLRRARSSVTSASSPEPHASPSGRLGSLAGKVWRSVSARSITQPGRRIAPNAAGATPPAEGEGSSSNGWVGCEPIDVDLSLRQINLLPQQLTSLADGTQGFFAFLSVSAPADDVEGADSHHASGALSARASSADRPLVWIPAASVSAARMSAPGMARRVAVLYSLESSHGQLLDGKDVPHNQEAATRAFRGLELVAKKEWLQRAQRTSRSGSTHATAAAARAATRAAFVADAA
ncbi:hypothetical protein AB1Y20_002206 [Prymnesium parvum]|uniref:RING-type domain-containing protein n=1 Tax=Prymnesium parvum TaxID=97485 RepID=A0AB34JAB3_PRYPA